MSAMSAKQLAAHSGVWRFLGIGPALVSSSATSFEPVGASGTSETCALCLKLGEINVR